jgi:tRNA A37 threonylcarbamoyladenosine biosynthesis protein TsaE
VQAGGGDFRRCAPITRSCRRRRGRCSVASEVADLVALMTNGARVVTITGPGGTGKTRLAIDVAHELEGRMADGVSRGTR